MDSLFRMRKQIIRDYLRTRYSDEQLVRALDHARAGRLAFHSCCCLIGLRSANHMRGRLMGTITTSQLLLSHYMGASKDEFDEEAEVAFKYIGEKSYFENEPARDRRRRAILVPMLLAEIRKRARQREDHSEDVPVTVANVR